MKIIVSFRVQTRNNFDFLIRWSIENRWNEKRWFVLIRTERWSTVEGLRRGRKVRSQTKLVFVELNKTNWTVDSMIRKLTFDEFLCSEIIIDVKRCWSIRKVQISMNSFDKKLVVIESIKEKSIENLMNERRRVDVQIRMIRNWLLSLTLIKREERQKRRGRRSIRSIHRVFSIWTLNMNFSFLQPINEVMFDVVLLRFSFSLRNIWLTYEQRAIDQLNKINIRFRTSTEEQNIRQIFD